MKMFPLRAELFLAGGRAGGRADGRMDRKTHRHADTNSRFSQFCERASKLRIPSLPSWFLCCLKYCSTKLSRL